MEKKIKFKINPKIITKEILFRVCTLYIEKVFIFIDFIDNYWQLEFTTMSSSKLQDIEGIAGEFKNMLVSEELREYLSADTRVVKQMIVSKALYGAGHDDQFDGTVASNDSLLGVDYKKPQEQIFDEDFFEDEDNYLEDPLGIAVSWTQKTGKEKKVKPIK